MRKDEWPGPKILAAEGLWMLVVGRSSWSLAKTHSARFSDHLVSVAGDAAETRGLRVAQDDKKWKVPRNDQRRRALLVVGFALL
jgi:hypothetical protein